MEPTPSPHLERGIYAQWGLATLGFNGPGYLSWAGLGITNRFKPDTSTRLAYDYEPVYPSSLLLHKSVECQYAVLSSQSTSYCLEEQIRCLDCQTQYVVLSRRLDTSYPTGRYGVSGDQSEQNTI
ncbi:hypothetical protein Tco_0880823 [Tanacetum coccineum]